MTLPKVFQKSHWKQRTQPGGPTHNRPRVSLGAAPMPPLSSVSSAPQRRLLPPPVSSTETTSGFLHSDERRSAQAGGQGPAQTGRTFLWGRRVPRHRLSFLHRDTRPQGLGPAPRSRRRGAYTGPRPPVFCFLSRPPADT